MGDTEITVSQIVEQIIDALSESISQLMMMVIILQERNADPPPALPNGVGIVTDSAQRLYQVAMALAAEDYAEYPDIRQEIEEAAESVNKSQQVLTSALNTLLSTSNKVEGWESLVQSCKNMSAKTIRLLQIVYGAERERVFRAAQKALDALAAVNPANARNGKEFAARAGEAATQANQLAEYVRGKASDAPPQKRQELLGLANQLNQGANNLINDANNLLRDPGNPNLQRKVADDLNDVRDTINRTTAALKDMDHEFDDAANDFEDRSAAMQRDLRDLASGDRTTFGEDLLLTAKKERQEMDNLLDDIDSGNMDEARRDLENAKLYNEKLAGLAGLEAQNKTNPAEKNAFLNAKRDLEGFFPQYENAVRQAMAHPDDSNYMDGLDDAHDRLDKMIERLCNLINDPNAQISASARKELEELDNLRDASRAGNSDKLGKAAKALAKENKALTGLCGAQADKMTDPLRKRQLHDAVEELQRLLPHELLAGKDALLNQSPDTLKQLDDKTNTMKDQVGATATMAKNYPELDMLDAAKREKNLLNNMQKAAEGGNPRDADNFANNLANNTQTLGDIAREIAKKKDRGQQAKIMDDVNKLNRLLQPTINDAKALAQNPNDAARKQQLAQKTDEMRALTDKLVADTDAGLFRECLIQQGNLHNMKNCADEKDIPGLANAGKETADRHKRMVPLIQAAAQRADTPARKNQLLADARALDGLLPRAINQTNAYIVDPSDANKNAMKKTVQDMEGIVKGLLDPTQYDPSIPRDQAGGPNDLARMLDELVKTAEYAARNPGDQQARQRLLDILNNLPLDMLDSDGQKLANMIRAQNEALDRLCKAAEQGDKAGVERAGNDMTGIHQQMKEQATKMANKLPDPEKKQKVFDALGALDKMIPATIQTARGVAANPRDAMAKKRLFDQAADVRDQLAILAGNAIGTNEERLRDAARLEKEALERLRKAVAAGDVPGTKAALADVKKYNNMLAEEGRECAGSMRDPALNKRVLDTITDLEKLMPILDRDCNNGAANPRNAQAQAAAMGDIKKCQDLIDALLRDTKADPIALAQIEDRTLVDMEQHIKKGDPTSANDVRKIIATQKDLKEAASKAAAELTNPRSQQNIHNALAELDQLLPMHINNGKAVLADINNEKNKDGLSDSTARMRAPLAQIIATLRPTPENIADANRKREAALLAQLREAARKGDTAEAERLLPAIDGVNQRLVDQARNEANQCANPEKKRILNEAANELESLNRELGDIARRAANNPGNAQAQAELAVHTKKMENAMDRIVQTIQNKDDSPAEKARRLANALIRGLQSGNMDPNRFLAGAKALADYINGLNLSGGDFDLDAELAALDKHSRAAAGIGRQKANVPLDGFLKDIKKPKPAPVVKAPPKTFDEAIQAVADDIGNNMDLLDLGEGDPVTILIRSIAKELTNLADAAKVGNRQNMVMAGRNACTRINELHALLKTYADRCKDPRTKERLLRSMQAMKNFSVQLKILTAVKAASGKNKDADTEEQLISVAKGLGNSLNESVNSVKVMRGANLLR